MDIGIFRFIETILNYKFLILAGIAYFISKNQFGYRSELILIAMVGFVIFWILYHHVTGDRPAWIFWLTIGSFLVFIFSIQGAIIIEGSLFLATIAIGSVIESFLEGKRIFRVVGREYWPMKSEVTVYRSGETGSLLKKFTVALHFSEYTMLDIHRLMKSEKILVISVGEGVSLLLFRDEEEIYELASSPQREMVFDCSVCRGQTSQYYKPHEEYLCQNCFREILGQLGAEGIIDDSELVAKIV